MNDPTKPAVILRGIGKTYRLYQKPLYRVLDLFGLCPATPAFYGEHIALRDIDLSIARGEKVAIIGRNGAGKSTLLKTITGNLRPTQGSMTINGQVSALLQIGTGFHPDFTGRQNIYSSLAHQGITGPEAAGLFSEILEFAELHEYIDQPVKTYSTGMGARLMFSAATAIKPDIIVIDELLGVGDAYFSLKSYERMRRMCSEQGTTLILVTHDLYAALNICERFIWIDRGTIKMDADGKSTLNAYEQSIKAQEEERLRRKNQSILAVADANGSRVRLEIFSQDGFALSEPCAIETIRINFDDGHSTTLHLGTGGGGWHLEPQGNLGPVETGDGRSYRSIAIHGSIFHKASWLVALPRLSGLRDVTVSYRHRGGSPVGMRTLREDGAQIQHAVLPAGDGWQERVFPFTIQPINLESANLRQSQYGTGELRIEKLEFYGSDGAPVVRVAHGGFLAIRLAVSVKNRHPGREVTFVVAFHKPGVAVAAYIHSDRLPLPDGDEVRIDAVMDPLLLGSGTWMVTVGLAIVDHYKNPDGVFFSASDRWHHLIPRGWELEVTKGTTIDPYAFFCQPARINVIALASPSEAGAASQVPP